MKVLVRGGGAAPPDGWASTLTLAHSKNMGKLLRPKYPSLRNISSLLYFCTHLSGLSKYCQFKTINLIFQYTYQTVTHSPILFSNHTSETHHSYYTDTITVNLITAIDVIKLPHLASILYRLLKLWTNVFCYIQNSPEWLKLPSKGAGEPWDPR